MTQAFWKPEPKRPERDWRMWAILGPIIISVLGFAGTGSFAFAFGDIGIVPDFWQSILIVVSSGLIVWGAEANTPGTVIECFRKVFRGEANGWDYSALVVSLIGTTANLLVTFARRLPIDAPWLWWVANWGPLIAGVAVAGDYYSGLLELGFLFGSWEQRYEQWWQEQGEWNAEHGIEEPVDRTSWPLADLPAIRRIAAGLNGERVGVTVENLQDILDRERLRLPDIGETTRRRWAETLRSGG